MMVEKPKLTLLERIERAYLIRKDKAVAAATQEFEETHKCLTTLCSGNLSGICYSVNHRSCPETKRRRARERRQRLEI